MSAPLRRTRGDLIATGAITAVCLLAVAGVWATAPIRSSHLSPAVTEYVAPDTRTTVPEQLSLDWARPDQPLPGSRQPLVVGGLVITVDDQAVVAVDPGGDEVWRYERDLDVCAVAAAWGDVVITYRSNAGCGDVVSLTASTGQYDDTRSSPAPDEVVGISSNDRVGTVSAQRLELWRSDLVRTIEYGEVEGIQEPNLQPNPGCTITSALTRTELLAVTDVCDGKPWLRLLKATPEESRKPEILHEMELDSPGARVIAIAQEAAAVYVPGETPHLVGVNEEGKEIWRRDVARSPLLDAAGSTAAFAPVVADLPHHMTWFDGERLYLLHPSTLEISHVIDGALGPGAAVGDRLLVPVADGIAVYDWDAGKIDKTIPVDRETVDGMVSLNVAGDAIVEKRGGSLVGLT
ncbi:hypothetical protein CATRI_03075 [Corynebacterium atrinae]|uniref:Rv3212 family protein n=1 Tax=Corynebacterium atrinae TaxID=1336740 RepID=UPI0025B5F0F8|nr:hypothetical protein [Corynebacterium atrinae]WJY62720.1 hypothetical protein CATRI_03075 [Corynebacterium atrinae]